ncbi:F0F1 ATP synthase subunit A [bacterium]|nr:F0F1 ATP synthase subunit A [bacterium]
MPTISLSPSVLFAIGPLQVTTTLLLQIVIIAAIAALFICVVRHWQAVPGKLQWAVESLVLAAYDQVDKITNDKARTAKLFPLAFTLFIFILVSNLVTVIPGLGALSWHAPTGDISLFRAALADYSMILVMTLIVVIGCQVVFISVNGPLKYVKKWLNFSSPLAFVLGLMDVISEFAKVLSLSFRLYGNVFAGEVLVGVMTALVPYFVPFPFFVLSTFSGVIQAYVFALLATIFLNQSLDKVE